MSVPTAQMVRVITRELDSLERELSLFPDDESIWATVPGVTNSAGNLGLHVAGGLQYLVGAVLGGTGYVRNRDAEFSRRSGSRQEVIAEIRKAAAVVRDVLPRLSDQQLSAAFPEAMMGLTIPTDLFLLHLCVHAGFHLGQAGYIRRVVTANATSTGPLPLQPLAE
jgi:hypothetical protein